MWQSTKWVDWNTGARIWKCRNHPKGEPYYQAEEPAQGLPVPPKILYLDIETSLMKAYIYDLYDEGNKRITRDMIDSRRFVINWAAAWVQPIKYVIGGGIMSEVVTPREARQQDDHRILKRLFDLMDESDYVVGHNAKGFDIKILKWRFLKHGMGYPAESKYIDTLTMARETKPETRGLEDLSVQLGGRPKRGLRKTEWRQIVETGDEALLHKADNYCRGDVREGVRVLRHFTLAKEQSGKVVFR